MKYTIDDAIHYLRKRQAGFKKDADKYNNDFDNRKVQNLKASIRMGMIADWLIDYKRLKGECANDRF